VQALRLECAGLDAQGRPRPRLQVAASLQRYLLFAILACVPDRQRTLRELKLGSTLVQAQGRCGEGWGRGPRAWAPGVGRAGTLRVPFWLGAGLRAPCTLPPCQAPARAALRLQVDHPPRPGRLQDWQGVR
jgi:hypothetical protein